ncbi:unnamed protein product [Pleuronectes platessa]|uniref:Uncharacterized protein n=1 Tax=Pleuronectes platessa TaxID=8262 RepID=A0A9N7TL79_PLEPL|nr:unnamed protein product [Pleuronectes platessa]
MLHVSSTQRRSPPSGSSTTLKTRLVSRSHTHQTPAACLIEPSRRVPGAGKQLRLVPDRRWQQTDEPASISRCYTRRSSIFPLRCQSAKKQSQLVRKLFKSRVCHHPAANNTEPPPAGLRAPLRPPRLRPSQLSGAKNQV